MRTRDVGAKKNQAFLLRTVVSLGELADQFVCSGGSATGRLVAAMQSPRRRVTIDVDTQSVIAEWVAIARAWTSKVSLQ